MLAMLSDARPAGMAAFVAVGDGVAGMSLNPAAVAAEESWSFSGTLLSTLADTRLEQITLVAPTPVANVGIVLGALQAGTVDVVEESGIVGTVDAQNDILIGVGVGRRFAPGIELGGTVKWYRSVLVERYRAAAVTADVGLRIGRADDEGFSVGASVRGLGGGVRYERVTSPLPRTGSVGFAWRRGIVGGVRALITSDVLADRNFDLEYLLGIELDVLGRLAFRAGGRWGDGSPGLGGGLGLNLGVVRFDYSMVALASEIEPASRVSLTIRI